MSILLYLQTFHTATKRTHKMIQRRRRFNQKKEADRVVKRWTAWYNKTENSFEIFLDVWVHYFNPLTLPWGVVFSRFLNVKRVPLSEQFQWFCWWILGKYSNYMEIWPSTTEISIIYTNRYCFSILSYIQRTFHEYHLTDVRFLLYFHQQIRFPISKHIVSPYFSMLFAILRAYLQIGFSPWELFCHEPLGYAEIMLEQIHRR